MWLIWSLHAKARPTLVFQEKNALGAQEAVHHAIAAKQGSILLMLS